MRKRLFENYSVEECAAKIAYEVIEDGGSSGWSSYKVEMVEEVENLLRKFNIVCTCEFAGEYGYQKQG